jgi:uncharacterized membrane protein
MDGGGTGAWCVARGICRLILAAPSRTQGWGSKGGMPMATNIAAPAVARAGSPLAVATFDKFLAIAAALLLAATLIAILRGRAEWGQVPPFVWAHLGTIIIAMALTPAMMLRRRGDRLHRQLGWVWVVMMAATALTSFNIAGLQGGGWSVIHILSVWTLIQIPLIVLHARAHRHVRHRSAVRGMVTGALVIAGIFTFPFDRMLGHWLFG